MIHIQPWETFFGGKVRRRSNEANVDFERIEAVAQVRGQRRAAKQPARVGPVVGDERCTLSILRGEDGLTDQVGDPLLAAIVKHGHRVRHLTDKSRNFVGWRTPRQPRAVGEMPILATEQVVLDVQGNDDRVVVGKGGRDR